MANKNSKAEPRAPQQARSKRTRQALLDAGNYLFDHHPYDDVNVSKITQRAKVAVGSFYGYFPDKQTLLLELMLKRNEGLMVAAQEALERARQKKIPFDKTLTAMVSPLADLISASERRVATMQRVTSSLPEFKKIRVQYDEIGRGIIFDLIQAYRNELKCKDPKTTSYFVWRLIDSSIRMNVLYGYKFSKRKLLSSLVSACQKIVVSN